MKKGSNSLNYIFTILLVGFLMLNLGAFISKTPQLLNSMQQIGNKSLSSATKIKAGISKMEDFLIDNVWHHQDYVNLNGLFLRMIDKNIMEDVDSTYHVYKMENEQLTFNYEEMDVRSAVDHLGSLQKYCEENGIQLLYIQIPYKVDKYNNELPDGYVDGANKSADMFLEQISELGVESVDYRDVLTQTEEDYSAQFFDGDHHWKTETAFKAYQYLIRYMRRKNWITTDARALNAQNFDFQTYKDSFIGSQLLRTGDWYTDNGADDFTVIIPKFDAETDFRREIYKKNGKLKTCHEGTFTEAIMALNAISDMSGAKTGRDSVYLGHNPSLDIIYNNQGISDNGELLFLEDSFGRPISAFCALQFPIVHIADLRYFKIPIEDYLKEHPGIRCVVVAYAASDFKPSTYEDFFRF